MYVDGYTVESYFASFVGDVVYETTVSEEFGRKRLLRRLYPSDDRRDTYMRIYHQNHLRRCDISGKTISTISELLNGRYRIDYATGGNIEVDGDYVLYTGLNER